VNGSVCNSNADIPEVRMIHVKAVQQERGLSHCTPRINNIPLDKGILHFFNSLSVYLLVGIASSPKSFKLFTLNLMWEEIYVNNRLSYAETNRVYSKIN
jgi:hypothetical protein